MGDLLVLLWSRRLGRRGIRLGVKDGWLVAYAIGLGREHSAEEGLTLWERLECDLVSFKSSGISISLASSLRRTHGPRS